MSKRCSPHRRPLQERSEKQSGVERLRSRDIEQEGRA
jgi:hypothetical protein